MTCQIIKELNCPSTSSNDYVRKLNLYMNAGVREYWIVDPCSEKIFVYQLEQIDLKVNTHTFRDKVKAGIYDNLWIDFKERLLF